MRNYFKTHGGVTFWRSSLFPGSTFYIVVFGGDEEDLVDRTREQWDIIRGLYPDAQFAPGHTEVIWWKLDIENFLTIINGVSSGYREYVWNGMLVTQIPNGFTDRWLTSITNVQSAGGKSPRKDWSGGH